MRLWLLLLFLSACDAPGGRGATEQRGHELIDAQLPDPDAWLPRSETCAPVEDDVLPSPACGSPFREVLREDPERLAALVVGRWTRCTMTPGDPFQGATGLEIDVDGQWFLLEGPGFLRAQDPARRGRWEVLSELDAPFRSGVRLTTAVAEEGFGLVSALSCAPRQIVVNGETFARGPAFGGREVVAQVADFPEEACAESEIQRPPPADFVEAETGIQGIWRACGPWGRFALGFGLEILPDGRAYRLLREGSDIVRGAAYVDLLPWMILREGEQWSLSFLRSERSGDLLLAGPQARFAVRPFGELPIKFVSAGRQAPLPPPEVVGQTTDPSQPPCDQLAWPDVEAPIFDPPSADWLVGRWRRCGPWSLLGDEYGFELRADGTWWRLETVGEEVVRDAGLGGHGRWVLEDDRLILAPGLRLRVERRRAPDRLRVRRIGIDEPNVPEGYLHERW